MSVLRFRRDRRQRDPFTAAPVAAPRFADPHGIATPSKLAELAAQAQAETAAPAPDLLADETHRWYGWDITALDNPPAHHRPYIPGVLGSEGRLSPRRAGVAEDLAGCVIFRDAVQRMTRPCCPDCQQASGTWQQRLYGTFTHHTRPVDEAAPRQFGIATELRQAHEGEAAAADRAERAFAERYLTGRAA
jgi:hypothetical protein